MQSLNRLAARVAGKVPLRTVVIVPFVLQIVGTVGLVGYLSFQSGQKAVEDLAQQLMAQVGERISDRITTYLHAPQDAVAANYRTVEQGMLNINDFEQLRRQLWQHMALNPSLEAIFFANEPGEEIGYGRVQSQELVKQAERLTGEDLSIGIPFFNTQKSTDPGKRNYYLVDAKGNPRKLIYTFPIDNSTTPWYRYGKAASQQTWSPVSIYKLVPSLGIFALTPIYDAAGKWQGVFASNFTLSGISTFLNQLKFSPSGQTFIIERSGDLVATSTLEIPNVKQAKGEPTRLLAVNSKDARTRDIARQLVKKFGNLGTLQTTQQLALWSNDERHFVRVTPYQDKYGLDWLVVVIVPESDFMEQIHANTRTTILLCITALMGSTTIGILTARWITKPILRLNTAAKDIAKGEWERLVEIERNDEVGELANSFNRMAAQLQSSFAELKSLNESLAQSESKLNQILQAIPVGVSVHDSTGKLIYANQTSRQLLGIETLPEAETEQLAEAYQVYQTGTEQLYLPENMPVVRSLQGEGARVDDMEIRLPDRTIPLEVYSTPLLDGTGNIVAAIAAFFDITQRKKAEELLANYNHTLEIQVAQRTAELAHTNEQLEDEIAERNLIEGKLYSSEQQVRTIFESITDVLLIIDEKKSIQVIPTKTLGLHNYDTNLLNAIVEQFFQENTQENWFAKVQQVVETQQSLNFDYSLSINNRQIWFTACISPLPDNSVVWVARDISDRKFAEQALIESEARFQAFMNYSPLLAWISDGDGKLLYCNRSVELWSERAASELIGETIFALHPPNIAQEHLENIRYVINTRQVLETNESAFSSDGTLHEFLSYKFPLIDANGQCLVGGIAADITIRKRAEDALQDSQARLQKLTNNVPGSIYEFVLHADGSNSLEYTSSAVRDIHELEPEQVLENATLLFDHMHPDDRASYSLAVEISAQTLELFQHEWRIITPSGKLKWLQATSKPERRSNGDIVWYGAVFDITDKKQAEDALRESANRERAIAQVLQRMRQSLDINTIFSTTTEELRSVIKCDRVVIYQFNPDWSGRFVAESVASGWRTLLLEQNNVPHLTDDILESENCAVRAWGVINEFIQDTYLQATQGGIYSPDDSYLASEDIYNTGLSPCHIDLLEQFQARAYLIVPIFCGNKLWGLLASYHNTSSRPWSASEINTVVQIGIQLGIALQQAQLLAETRQQSVALQQAAYAADAANRAKSTFLANMSHELRTPLNGIMGYAQILQGDKNCTPKQKEGVDIIYQCGTHLLTLINDILDLSKIEAERLELYPEDIHLPTFLAEMSEIFQLKAVQKDINFTYLPLNSLPTGIQADKKRLRQVLMNLLSNAIKFTDRGSVTFKVARIDNDRQEQSPITHQPSPITKIRFQVEDTGIGMPPDQLEKIFLPFEQVGDKSRRSEGTGLGLAISQRIVEMMESQILVESTPGVGSKFWFDLSLPEILTSTLPMSVKSTESIIGYSGLKKKILVVDDRWENCAVLINMLEPIGFEVLEAANGQEGLEKAVEFQPDLILVDLVMPVMDGFEMTRQLRLFSQLKNTVVIAVSANAFAVDQQKSIESGCNDFLPKPVQTEELLTKMKDYLNVSWIYQERRGEQASTNSAEMVIPAHEELMNLYEAANSGDIEGVEQECMRLQDLSSEYIFFVIRVLELAQAFEYEEIARLIDRYLSQDSQ